MNFYLYAFLFSLSITIILCLGTHFLLFLDNGNFKWKWESELILGSTRAGIMLFFTAVLVHVLTSKGVIDL